MYPPMIRKTQSIGKTAYLLQYLERSDILLTQFFPEHVGGRNIVSVVQFDECLVACFHG